MRRNLWFYFRHLPPCRFIYFLTLFICWITHEYLKRNPERLSIGAFFFSLPTVFPSPTGIFPLSFYSVPKAKQFLWFPGIFRPTKPQLNWNENQILMKQTMKRHHTDGNAAAAKGPADWVAFSFHTLSTPFGFSAIFILFVLGSNIVDVLVAALSVFCFLSITVSFFMVFVSQWIEWAIYTTHSPKPPHIRSLVASHESTFIRCKPFHSLLCKFSFILFFAALSIGIFVFLFFSGHLPNAFASHFLIYSQHRGWGQQNFAQQIRHYLRTDT